MANNKNQQSVKDQISALKNLPKFFQLIWGTNKWMFLSNIILRTIKAVIPLGILFVGKEIIDAIVEIINHPETPSNYLWTMVALEFGLAIFSDVINRAITLIDNLLGDLVANETSESLIKHAASLDLYQFEDAKFYDKLERARTQTRGRTTLMTQVLSQFQDSITIVSLGIGLVAFNPWLILILIVAIIPSFLGETHFNQQSYSLTTSWTPERRELDYVRFIGASDHTVKEIKTFGLANFLAERFKTLAHKYYVANRKLSIKRAFVGSLLTTMGTLSYYGAFVYIIVQTTDGLITLGTLTFLAGSFQRMRNMLQGIMNRFSKIAERALYLKDLFDFFDIRPSIVSLPNAIPFPEKVKSGFTFENVSFKYHNSEKYVIKNLSFHLKAGEKLALVGENGAGKTTLVKLLARLYEPTEGRILIDGIDIKSYNLPDLRNNIAIIFQDYAKFQMKANENIAVGDIGELKNNTKISSAAQKSLANSVIDELPMGYNQMLGRRFEKGIELSGGQWQKIALARAYMRDAQLLILDEPTSSLDARAEHEVFLRFAELIKSKSAVLISHRFSTVRMADKILFLENGTKLEMGTHQELMEKNGKYAELFSLQAKGYQ